MAVGWWLLECLFWTQGDSSLSDPVLPVELSEAGRAMPHSAGVLGRPLALRAEPLSR